jgi:hypothetical protein
VRSLATLDGAYQISTLRPTVLKAEPERELRWLGHLRRSIRTPSDVHSRGPAGVQLSDQLILAGVLQAILYLFFVRAIDLYEREPLPYVVAVFLWGFAVATTIALFFNTLAKTTFATLVSEREANALTAILVAPVVEESAKGSRCSSSSSSPTSPRCAGAA